MSHQFVSNSRIFGPVKEASVFEETFISKGIAPCKVEKVRSTLWQSS